jgi:acetoin:2,6-dichlorophenolindophenol oxidoreductase subunit alpha
LKPALSGSTAAIAEKSLPWAEMYRLMTLIREAEDGIAERVESGEIKCPAHLCVGQEGIAVGVCSALTKDDYVFGAHRSHGHYLAKGGDLRQMMAEIYGRTTGCAKGRGGSMHLVAPEVGILGTVPIVAATIPIAVGAGLASKLRNETRVSVTFFGDGAVEEGVFHESMNLAATLKAPVIFICENNLYSSHLHILERRVKDNIIDSAAAHGMPGEVLDGNDIVAVYAAVSKAVERARKGLGPTFFELRTYRWRGHVGASYDLDVGVQRKDELQDWKKKDPIASLAAMLLEQGKTPKELEDVRVTARSQVEAAIAFAKQSPFPKPEDLADFVYSNPRCMDAPEPPCQ